MKEMNGEMIRLSMKRLVLLSLIYALTANTFMYAAYFNRGIVDWNTPISAVLAVAYAVPVVQWFRNRYWYFPVFIFLFWIPFSVLIGYGLSLILPLEDYGTGSLDLLIFVYFIINIIVVLLGIAIGMIVNGLLIVRAPRSSHKRE